MWKSIFVVLSLVFAAHAALAESEGEKSSALINENKNIDREIKAGIGLPYGLEVLGRFGGKLGRVSAGAEVGGAPLFMSPSLGLYTKVDIDSNGSIYTVASMRHMPVLLGDRSDMKSIRTMSIGVGKKLESGSSIELQLARSTREHKDFCNVDNCTPNGTSHSNGVMLYYGSSF